MTTSDERPVGDLSYEEASAELDAIIAELDAGTIDVDTLGARYQRAAEIAEELDRRLRENRARIDELAPRLARLATSDEEADEAAGEVAPSEEPF